MGVHKRGVGLRDLVGGRWATPKEVMKDIALGAGLWGVWIGLMNAHVLGGGTNAAQGLLPHGILQSVTLDTCCALRRLLRGTGISRLSTEAISGDHR